MNILKVIIYFYFLVVCHNVFGQDCKGLLLEYIDRISGTKLTDEKRIYYLHFKVSYNLWDTKKPQLPDLDSKIYLGKNLYFYESNLLSIYSDKKDFICVYPSQKQIICSDAKNENNKEKMETMLSQAQKEIVVKGKLIRCADTLINDVSTIIMTILVPPGLESNYKMTKVTYYYSVNKKQLNKVIIFYSKQHTIKSQTIIYEEINFNYKETKFQRAHDLVFDRNEHLKSKYKTYSIIDNRK